MQSSSTPREGEGALANMGENTGGALEGHLRNLILDGEVAQREGQAPAPPTSQLPHPPHMPEPSGSGPRVQPPESSSARKGKKRPNQAQRRQMSAQLSLPIGLAASPSPPAPFSAPYPGGDFPRARQWHPTGSYRGQQSQASFDGSQAQGWPQAHPPRGSQPLSPWGAPVPHTRPDTAPSPFPPREWHREHSYPHGRRPNHSLSSLPVTWRAAGPVTHRGSGLPAQSGMHSAMDSETLGRQAELLNKLCSTILAGAEIDRDDIARKEAFRVAMETLCRRIISVHECEHNGVANFSESSVQLKCFGSLSSGFATKASDMDLGLLSPMSRTQPDAPGSPIPRLLEKAFLDTGLGARLLTRTRVPIIKLCEDPPPQLLMDLRKEREKWECGVGNEVAGVTEEGDPQDTQFQSVFGVEQGSIGNATGGGEVSNPRVEVISEPQHDTDPSSRRNRQSRPASEHDDGPILLTQIPLSQADSQSLSAYYGSAKRVLRKLGGYDLTASNHRNFSGEDSELLAAVGHAFVVGLRDKALRDRLCASPTFQAQSTPSLQNARSLLGIYTQAEGEAILIRWERRTARERTDERERAVTGAVESWKTARNKTATGFDCIYLAKELQVSLERLKKFPSVQLVLLEQGQYESATFYSDRAAGLIPKLAPRYSDSDETSEAEVLRRYISGVYHDDTRTALADLCRELGEVPSFPVAVRKHKALQLAHELEKALAAGLYMGMTRQAADRYAAVLREPMRRVVSANGREEWAIPVSSGSTALATIRCLQDPSTVAPNQPRDPYNDKLEFPRKGAGVQCDINFSAHLALQNTLLLRCYSHTDPRVRPLVLFVKHWAKVRGINTPYRGTLSSYGYVLMALHFLVNVAKPFVCPNLQMLAPPPSGTPSSEQVEATTHCKGRDIRFWRNEQEIIRLARENSLNQNGESVGDLLRGFFEYYAHGGALLTLPGRGFDWGREVLSLRTHGGILTKQEKGWTGAKTTTIVQGQSNPSGDGANPTGPSPISPVNVDGPPSSQSTNVPLQGPSAPAQPKPTPQKSGEVREVRHRYLLAIEDPFELDHNVARTVTHNGIVSVRDEFRRAWRVIQSSGFGREDEDLLQPVTGAENDDDGEAFCCLLAEIHATTPEHIRAMDGGELDVV